MWCSKYNDWDNYIVYFRVTAEKMFGEEFVLLEYLLAEHTAVAVFFVASLVVAHLEETFTRGELLYHLDFLLGK